MDEVVQTITTFISTVGFPIAVAAFVLIKMDKTMADLTKVMTKILAKLDVDDGGPEE